MKYYLCYFMTRFKHLTLATCVTFHLKAHAITNIYELRVYTRKLIGKDEIHGENSLVEHIKAYINYNLHTLRQQVRDGAITLICTSHSHGRWSTQYCCSNSRLISDVMTGRQHPIRIQLAIFLHHPISPQSLIKLQTLVYINTYIACITTSFFAGTRSAEVVTRYSSYS